ncbi:MAG TPA: GDP-mannose 4,6-dehydratase [Candidatus Angelobacter sp.]|jgi:CDP-paratose 2-epimerase|nr:GDP-mannose 4,6-dehydratase [Candidatus Angelobacter sp.]
MNTPETRSVLIFGGAGFIGSNLAHHLLAATDARVHIFDNLARDGAQHNLEWLKKKAAGSGRLQVTVADIRDARAVEKAVAQATEIYHLAAQVAVTTSVADPRLDFEVNLGGTFNILDAARKCGHQPLLVFTSTNKVYGDLGLGTPVVTRTNYIYPHHTGVSESQRLDFHSPYGCSKGAADQYVHDFARIYKLPTVVFRMSCIAGPRQFGTEDQGWVAHFVYSALQKKPVVIYGDGRQVRDVLSVNDLVRAFDAVQQHRAKTQGEIFNIGGGMENTVSLLELIELIEEMTGHSLQYVLDERRPGDQLVYITDYTKIMRATGWKPATTLQQTLEALWRFWEENQNIIGPVDGRMTPAEKFAVATQLSGRAG